MTATPRVGAAGAINQPLKGKMLTLISMTSAITSGDITNITSYLSTRWGI